MKLQLKNNMLINPYIFGGGDFAINIDGLGFTAVFSLAKVSTCVIDTPISILNANLTGSYYFVDWDENFEISLNSPAYVVGGSPSSQTLGDIVGSDSWDIVEWFDQVGGTQNVGRRLTGQAGKIRLVTSGALNTKNGKVNAEFLGNGSLQGNSVTQNIGFGGYSPLDSGNDFTLVSVSHNDSSGAVAGLFSNVPSLGSGAKILYNDRRTNKVVATLQDTGATNYNAFAIAQDDTANQKRLTSVLDHTGQELIVYKDAVSQDTVDITGESGWANSDFRIGERTSDLELTGGIQFFGVINQASSSADVTTIDNNLDAYFSF